MLFLSEKWNAIQTVGCESESYSGDFVGPTVSSSRFVNPAKRCGFESHFLSEPTGKCNVAGTGRESWIGSATLRVCAVSEGDILEQNSVKEFCRPIRIPTANSHN